MPAPIRIARWTDTRLLQRLSGLSCVPSVLMLLSACTTLTAPPATENGAPVVYAPVVESSIYSDGAPVTAATSAPPSANADPDIATPANTALSGLHLQAGTFSSQDRAKGVAASIRSKAPQYAQLVRVQPRGSNWRVLIGPFATDTERAHATGVIRNAIGSDVVNAAP
jgi:hypothetical protein